ncbi:uncharacterized protein [Henckelia pumila]|uniref:uncharacterized protein n=1 Tax=Henckelia pumila TaxID=405737 RepID=UPI003C6E233D
MARRPLRIKVTRNSMERSHIRDNRGSRGPRGTIKPRDLLLPGLRISLFSRYAAVRILGRVFVMQAEEADPDTTLIKGRIVLAGVATRALLDSGATHSFISEAFTRKRSIEYEEFLGGFTVTIPSGEELSTRNIVRNLELLLQGQSVSADLIVLPMPEFDLILGMDWMTKNAVVIDFQQRSVMVRPEGEEPFWFEATRSSKRTQLISLL